jgi:hypothetical protein
MRCHITNRIQGHPLGTPFMKHPTEKRSEQAMRFFMPDLYLRFNSANENEADRANDEWENALQSYRQHLESIWDQLPSQVRSLTELSLHDAELQAIDQQVQPLLQLPIESGGKPWSAVAILSLTQDGDILSLIYFLCDHIREYPLNAWPFSKQRPHWLYDEIDVGTEQGFIHRVLLSDGRVIEIPFASAVIHKLPLPALEATGRRTA